MSTKKYRVVIVGCGGISNGWLSAVRDHYASRAEVVGFVDLSLENAQKRATEFGAAHAWVGSSLEEALQTLQPDAVFNCTIPEAHTSTCQTALKAGCHVLVEKPLAPTVAEGRELIAASAQAGKCLAVIQNRRYVPGVIMVRQALADGVIGTVHTICADFFLAPRFGGFRDAMQHPLLLDMSIHTFDQARFLSGLDANKVFCHEFNPQGSWYAQGASAMAIFEMTGGAVFNYRGSWCAQGLSTSWHSSWRIIGTQGTLVWNGEHEITFESLNGPSSSQEFMQPVTRQTLTSAAMSSAAVEHAGNIGEFLDALDKGISPQTIATDNVKSLSMVEAAVKSAESHREVSF